MNIYAVCYLIIINAAAFIIFALDKFFAVKHMWRISEFVLILLCLFGGSAGGLLAMKIYRHKTKHPKFKYGVPVILIVQIILIIYFCADKTILSDLF